MIVRGNIVRSIYFPHKICLNQHINNCIYFLLKLVCMHDLIDIFALLRSFPGEVCDGGRFKKVHPYFVTFCHTACLYRS